MKEQERILYLEEKKVRNMGNRTFVAVMKMMEEREIGWRGVP